MVQAVYPQLRRIARLHLRRERNDHTLQATALVNEAYLQLLGQQQDFKDRCHFFAAAAQAMRRILVDYARQRQAKKRAGGLRRVELHETAIIGGGRLDDVLAIDEALARLEQWDARQCRVVELRFFAGLTEAEIAELLGVAERTVKRDWSMARAWLHAELRSTAGDHL